MQFLLLAMLEINVKINLIMVFGQLQQLNNHVIKMKWQI